jgi:MATE family multidrug resistance protein
MEVVGKTARVSVIIAVAFSLLYVLFGHQLIALLTSIASVRQAAGEYLPWLFILPLVGVWCFLFDGVFIGATKGVQMRNSMIFSAIGYLIVWYFTRSFGNHGLWLAFLCFLLFRGASMYSLFIRMDRRNELMAK